MVIVSLVSANTIDEEKIAMVDIKIKVVCKIAAVRDIILRRRIISIKSSILAMGLARVDVPNQLARVCMSIAGLPMDIATMLLIAAPAYLANTGAMLFGKWLPEKFNLPKFVIDGGKDWRDGNRILGDGKSWNGLFGGAFFSGLLMMSTHFLFFEQGLEAKPFVDPLFFANESHWFWFGSEWGAAFTMGFILGFGCLIGDSLGSFVKRRTGLKREGDISSKAPILDTLPFAILIFVFAYAFFPNQIIVDESLKNSIIGLIIITPIIHRTFNIFGHKVGLKNVPY
jgi:CDP-2,3-bis-(O-geranylgeranyl)-sn-glycerol synthase